MRTNDVGQRFRSLTGLALVLAATIAASAEEPTSLASQEEAAIRAAVDQVADSVVQIRTIGGLEEVDRTLLTNGPTTGIVISPDGWIVSSSFNFLQQPASILVTFADGEQAPAELVAKDHSRMLVLLKAQGVSDLAVPKFVPLEEICVGQWAIAMGRAFRTDRPNISVGIVSALGRMFGKAIQTDADVSTANYGGPLVDIRGRVYGVIVPMSPQSTSEVVGAEWYDSGIGFAVPLASIADAIERMKQGDDQRAGVMGIAMAAENSREAQAKLATVLPTSPAGKAGLKKDDEIVEIDGRPIQTQMDLKFALGSKYAGDTVRVSAKRGEEQLERSIELAGELEPFRHAFLGILPIRETSTDETVQHVHGKEENEKAGDEPPVAGIEVRFVYPDSPASQAGIEPGDRVVSINDAPVKSIKSAVDAMNAVLPGAKVAVRMERGGQHRDLQLTAASLPTNVLNDLPPASISTDTNDDKADDAFEDVMEDAASAKIELSELKLAEFSQTCRVYVPPTLEDRELAGVLLWLHPPGEPPTDELFLGWKSICDRDGLILVAPSSSDLNRWERTELEYLRKLSERVLAEYRVDRQRVVVLGREGGGAMAYLLALVSPDLFTGVATTAASLPRTVTPPQTQPPRRLAIFAGLPSEGSSLAQVQAGLKKLRDAGYPVTAVSIVQSDGQLSVGEREQLARWIDSLDRF
jgi:serine protease Do